jgi:hypothetical protein
MYIISSEVIMAFTFNGIGTTHYGKRNTEPDGSYITTVWFVLFYLPILPLRSLHVRPKGKDVNFIIYSSQKFDAKEIRLNIKQVINIYLGTYGTIAVIYFLLFGLKP